MLFLTKCTSSRACARVLEELLAHQQSLCLRAVGVTLPSHVTLHSSRILSFIDQEVRMRRSPLSEGYRSPSQKVMVTMINGARFPMVSLWAGSWKRGC